MYVRSSPLTLCHVPPGTQEQACQAIDHVTRIICVKAPKLHTPSKTRRVPKSVLNYPPPPPLSLFLYHLPLSLLRRGLNKAELTNVTAWLLVQCGSPETACREKCRSVFCQLTRHQPSETRPYSSRVLLLTFLPSPPLPPPLAEVPSERVWIRNTFESEGGCYYVLRYTDATFGTFLLQLVSQV